MAKTKEFDSMPDAFDYCREANMPVVVIVAGERWKLFPSGKAIRLADKVEHNWRNVIAG